MGLLVGYIARPAEENTARTTATQSQRELDPPNPYFVIAGTARSTVGDSINKVGYTTGWTSGTVTETCVWLPLGDNDYNCIDFVNFYGEIRDNGSPAFSISNGGQVVLRGIHFAADGFTEAIMPIDQVLDGLFYDRGVNSVWAVPLLDYDSDDDGLIEISSLAQLDAIRWNLDGDGSSEAAGYSRACPHASTGMECPDAGCAGYELAVDLDFDTDGDGDVVSDDDYWNGGAGWDPIADRAGLDDTAKFDATFEGNGHAVTDLFINRVDTDDVGLFSVTRTDSELRNVGLTDANITGGS